jgi:phage terminase small subunit
VARKRAKKKTKKRKTKKKTARKPRSKQPGKRNNYAHIPKDIRAEMGRDPRHTNGFDITDKQVMFVEHLLCAAKWNATKAAKLAGYSAKTAYTQGPALLRNPSVQKYLRRRIQDRRRRLEVKQDKLIAEMAAIAFAKPSEFIMLEKGRLELKDLDDIPISIQGAVKGYESVPGKYGTALKVRFQDKIAAGRLLMQHFGMLEIRPRDGSKGSRTTPHAALWYAGDSAPRWQQGHHRGVHGEDSCGGEGSDRMKICLRILLAVLTLPFLFLWLAIPPICLLVMATEYAWTGRIRYQWRWEMDTVRDQQNKCKDLRKHLVKWINERPGRWLLGINVADDVRTHLRHSGIHTSAEVLAKELRKAQRKREIRKRIRPGSCYVEYMANAPEGMMLSVVGRERRRA